MPSWKLRAVAVASAVVLLGATASVSAAQAQPNFPHHSPSVSLKHLPKSIQIAINRAKTNVTVPGNALLNADVLLIVINGAAENLAAEGHLSLHKKKGTTYSGTFVDNLHGAKKYSASATSVSTTEETGRVTLRSHNGTFHFTMTAGSAAAPTAAPSKYGHSAVAIAAAVTPHLYTANRTLSVFLAGEQFGQYHRPIQGQLKLTTDSLSFVVPYISHSSSSKFDYSMYPTSKVHEYKVSSWGQYTPSNGSNGGFLQLSLKANGSHYSILANEQDGNTEWGFTNPLNGTATSGSGSDFFSTQFSAGIAAI